MTNLHQLTSPSPTSCPTTWRSYRHHRLLWRHFTLSLNLWRLEILHSSVARPTSASGPCAPYRSRPSPPTAPPCPRRLSEQQYGSLCGRRVGAASNTEVDRQWYSSGRCTGSSFRRSPTRLDTRLGRISESRIFSLARVEAENVADRPPHQSSYYKYSPGGLAGLVDRGKGSHYIPIRRRVAAAAAAELAAQARPSWRSRLAIDSMFAPPPKPLTRQVDLELTSPKRKVPLLF